MIRPTLLWLAVCTPAVAASPSAVLDFSLPSNGSYAHALQHAQAFKVGVTGILDSAEVNIYRGSNLEGFELKVWVTQIVNGVPSLAASDILAATTFDAPSELFRYPFQDVWVPFELPDLFVSEGQHIALVFQPVPIAVAALGCTFTHFVGGGFWGNLGLMPTGDFSYCIRTYVIPVPEPRWPCMAPMLALASVAIRRRPKHPTTG